MFIRSIEGLEPASRSDSARPVIGKKLYVDNVPEGKPGKTFHMESCKDYTVSGAGTIPAASVHRHHEIGVHQIPGGSAGVDRA